MSFRFFQDVTDSPVHAYLISKETCSSENNNLPDFVNQMLERAKKSDFKGTSGSSVCYPSFSKEGVSWVILAGTGSGSGDDLRQGYGIIGYEARERNFENIAVFGVQDVELAYTAIQIGSGNIKNSKISKQMKGFFAKKNTEPKKILKEFRVKSLENFKEGNEVGIEIFKDTKFVDIKSRTIGKGFAGVMKRHNFSGLRATHGVSVSHRSHGSTGQRQDPGKVFKGKKMAGQMGNKHRTIQNIEIIKTDSENDLLYLKGSIPGSKNTQVLIKKAVKNVKKLNMKEKIEIIEKQKKIPEKKKKDK